MKQFKTIGQLTTWLQEQGLDLTQWGKGRSKTVENLWVEISSGETVLQRDPLLRIVEVARVIVQRNGMLLIESYQDFYSGRRRARGRPPSEKMRPGENYLDAARRCLEEELGVTRENIQLLPNTYQRKEHRTISNSYPGLCTHYTFHVVHANVEGLPNDNFSTEEQATGVGESIRSHHWVWRKRVLPSKP